MMKRMDFVKVAGLGGLGILTGCKSLDTSAAAEGTGIQFTGLIKVLAKYPATSSQKTAASQRAGKAYVDTALKPAYEKRKKQIAAQSKGSSGGASAPSKKEVKEAKAAGQPIPEAKPSASPASDQLAALNAAWYQEASRATQGAYTGGISVPKSSGVAYASIQKEASALLSAASSQVPKYLAVSVPEKGVAEESRNADSVMFWNTDTQELAKNEVYVIDKKPASGKSVDFDGINAMYVGR